MKRLDRMLRLLALVLVVAPVAARAELFTVELEGGRTFATRYKPRLDEGAGKVYVLTDMGNWISLDRARVVNVSSEFENRGFGRVIDTTTIDLGIAPNEREAAEEAGSAELDPTQVLMRYLQGQASAPAENYTLQQFVEPEQAGGIPIGMTRTTTPPMGAVGEPIN